MIKILKIIMDLIRVFFKGKPLVSHTPLKIQDISKELSWHPTRTWSKRALSSIKKIVVHQSLTSYKNSSLSAINSYHIKPGKQNHISPNGAPHICYHFGIDGDGNTFQLNNLSSTVWHCKGQNTAGIGILILGDFDGPSYTGKDVEPTEAQLKSLGALINNLLSRENLAISKQDTYGHADFGKDNCPGTVVSNFIDKFKNT